MVREIRESDIVGLNNLAPKDWNNNYESFVTNFFSDDFFHACVKIHNGKIVGTGNVLVKDKVGWLGNIMVHESSRGMGFGQEITQYLVDFLDKKGCSTQLLIATELGEAVYTKLGFKRMTRYIRFDSVVDSDLPMSDSVRKLEASDLKKVHQLDSFANDENRLHLIQRFYQNGWGDFDENDELMGFYLPHFGRGLVIAKNQQTGFRLLQIKHASKGKRTLIPIENKKGIAFLENLGLQKGELSSRMILGEVNQWQPEMIFSYGSGYCG